MYNSEVAIHTMKLHEMFLTFNTKSVSFKKKEMLMYGNDWHKRKFVERVFSNFLRILIDDIVENGTQFQFSHTTNGTAWLQMQCISGDEYMLLRKRGALKCFDPVDTNFHAYRIEFYAMKPGNVIFTLPVHVSQKHTNRIVELTVSGKLKLGKVKAYPDYIDATHALYPKLDRKDIARILRYGTDVLKLHMFYGADFEYVNGGFVMHIGKIYENSRLMLIYVLGKMKRKIRIMYRKLHLMWDGYTYFSLTKDRYEAIEDDLKNGRMTDFGEVILYKCYDDCIASSLDRYAILKVKAGDPKYRFTNRQRLIVDDAELLETIPVWNLKMINFQNRKYQTLFPKTVNLYKMAMQNGKVLKVYLETLRKQRIREKQAKMTNAQQNK